MNPDAINPAASTIEASVHNIVLAKRNTVVITWAELQGDGRYVAWATWHTGDTENLVTAASDIRSVAQVFSTIGEFVLDIGTELDVVIRKCR